jgi:S1/P1 Nuclease
MEGIKFRATALLLGLLAMCFGVQPVRAWGCKGHQTVALVAEKHLTPEARALADKLLSENPIDPQLKRYCAVFAGDLLADGSTWPDDVRKQLANGPWHYINIPRGAPRKPLEDYCGEGGCVTEAIARQWAILKDKNALPAKRAEALRYLTHFVGDLHMPLHATTNNDMGGNCVPVSYFWRRPHLANNSYVPNLHGLWDTSIVEHDMEGGDSSAYASFLEEKFATKIEKWVQTGVGVEQWAWESHDLAETVTYNQLLPMIPVEKPAVVDSCTDAGNIGKRMLDLQVTAGEAYQSAAAGVVEERLEQAGVRLALMLNEAAKPASQEK